MIRSAHLTQELAVAVLVLAVASMAAFLASTQGLAAVSLPFVLAGGALIFVYPVVGLFLLAGTIPVEAALMMEGVSAPRLIGMAVFGVWGSQKFLRKEPLTPLVSAGLIQVAMVLLILACASLLWAQYPEGQGRQLFLLFQLILLSILVLDLASSWERVVWIARFLVLAALFAGLLTLEQYFIGGARRAGSGVVGGINRTAVTLVAVLPFAFFLLRSNRGGVWRWLGLVYIGIAGVAVAVTFSRMNFLLFPAVVVANLLLMARTGVGRRRIVLLTGVAALALFLLPLPMERIQDRIGTIGPYITDTLGPNDPADTYSGRGFHMRVGLEIFRDHPILGAGYNNYNPHFLTYQWDLSGAERIWRSPRDPHSSHLAFLANLGAVGFLLWLSLFAVVACYLWRAWRRVFRPPGTDPRFLIQAVGLGVILQFIFAFYSQVHVTKIFWLLLGMVAALDRISERVGQGEEVGSPAPERVRG